MKKNWIFLATPAIILFLFAGIMREDVSETSYINLGKEKQFDAVGKVSIADKFSGSCVLIGKRYVLSAAHIFKRYTFKPETLMMGGNKVIANIATDAGNVPASDCKFTFNGVAYQGKNIHFYTDSTTGKEAFDMILIELMEDVKNVKPATVNKQLDELNADVIGVGYGASGFANKPAEVKRMQLKIAGENVVDSLGGKKRNNQPTLLVCDFDSPTRPELNRIGSSTPKRLEYACNGGDSGGGMFRKKNGKWELVGICASSEAGMDTILTNGYYGLLMMWTRTAVFNDWISEHTK